MNKPLPRLTEKQRISVNTLVKNECCNYDEGNCLLLDDGETHCCPQLITYSLLCQYFRRAVLPLRPDLENEILSQKPKNVCRNCNKPFEKIHHNQLYCTQCAESRKKWSNTLSARRQRDKKRMKSSF